MGVGIFAVGEGRGDGRGVATALDPEFEAKVVAGAVLPVELELPPLRALDELDRSAEFLLANDEGGVEALRLLAFAFRFESGPLTDRGRSRPALDALEELPPATVNTTSSRFERCSTRAVAPGWSRKETTVLSPLRCAFTSAKPRPRIASVRGTSAAGILT